jgi:putative spermidine/putrescine transport system permease protein
MMSPGCRTASLMLPALVIVALLLVIPVGLLLELSFHQTLPGRITPQPGFTLASYVRALGDPYYLDVLGRTLWLSVGVTLVTIVLGFPLAYLLWRADPKRKTLLTLLIIAPLMISLVVRSYGWMVLLGDSGVINEALLRLGLIEEPLPLMYTNGSVFLGLVHVQLPFMVLSLLSAMERTDPVLLDAAETLAASRLRAILEVLLPMTLPGMVGGATLVFTLNMTAFVTPQLLGGSGSRVMTTLIYSQFTNAFNWPLGSALAMILSLASLALVMLLAWLAGRLPMMQRLTVLQRH